MGRDIFDFMIPPDQMEHVEEVLSHLQGSPGPLKSSNWNLTHEGHRILCECQNSLLRNASGQIAGAIALARDITEQQRIEAALKASEQRYRLLAENAFDVIWTADLNGRFTFISPSVVRLRGYSVEEAMQQSLLETLDPASVDEVQAAFNHLRQTGELLKHHWEIAQPCKDGSRIATEVIVNLIHDAEGRPQELFGITRDITERKRLEARLLNIAHYDGLTGLPNRTLFFDRLEQEIKQAHREKQRFALLFLDLDGFKAANDRHGHDFGDAVLCEVARRLQSHVRETDTVARMGGDEFTIILGNLHPEDRAEALVQQILANLAEVYRLQGKEASLSASIGVSIYPDNAIHGEQLLKCADSAMYQVKHSGKNAYAYSQEH
jgi:diguanylate cyclase (GGDEF)-like protein/PAS domain S-box-containing protein